MAINFARIKKIEDLTSNILEEFGLLKVAIDIKKVAIALGVHCIPYDLGEEMSGVLVLKNDIGTIGYNQDHADQRQRFTIAHELGHYILHRKNHNDVFVDRDFIIMYRRGANTYSELELTQEQEANAFAASILMPISLIENELKVNNNFPTLSELQVIDKLAKTFKVSSPAMTFRLNNLSVLG